MAERINRKVKPVIIAADSPADATYLTLSANPTLINERILVPGSGLTATDSGPGANYTLDVLTTHSVTVSDDSIKLVNDITSPGAYKYYNTDSGGTKGWNSLLVSDGYINTAMLSDAAVTTAKIANQAVTTAKLSDQTVTTAKIADAAVTTAKLSDASVTTAKLVNASVTDVKLAPVTIVAVAGNVTLTNRAVHTVSSAAARTLTLPAHSSGQVLWIVDSTGSCETNNFTLARTGGGKIMGLTANYDLRTNWGSWMLVDDGTDWYIFS